MVSQAHMIHVLVKLSKKALRKLPAVTLAVLAFTVYLYEFPAAPLNKVIDEEKEEILNNCYSLFWHWRNVTRTHKVTDQHCART